MGLRQRKAERTRAAIIEAARRLFETNGYHHTTMEQIAAAAEVGESTLYRYFPQKELILIEPLADSGRFATLLAQRDPAEPLPEALAHTLLAFLENAEPLRGASARRHLLAVQERERTFLEEAIAQRAGVAASELWVAVAARLTITIGYLAIERAFHEGGSPPSYARESLGMLRAALPQAVARG